MERSGHQLPSIFHGRKQQNDAVRDTATLYRPVPSACDRILEPRHAAFVEAPEHGVLDMGGLVLDRDTLVTQLSPHGYDLGEPFNGLVPLHNSGRHDRDILCDQPRIEAIVLGQHTAGTGELTKFVRVDTSHRQTRREQGTNDPEPRCWFTKTIRYLVVIGIRKSQKRAEGSRKSKKVHIKAQQ